MADENELNEPQGETPDDAAGEAPEPQADEAQQPVEDAAAGEPGAEQPDADAAPSAEEAVEATADAAGQVEEAAAESPTSDMADSILAAAKAAVEEAASIASDAEEGGADSIEDMMAQAMAEEAALSGQAQPAAQPAMNEEATERLTSLDLPSFDVGGGAEDAKGIDLLSDVNLNVSIELGRTRMSVEDVLKLSEGAVVELDKLAGDPVDVYVNERLVARGEVLVLNDTFCIRVNEIVKQGAEIVAEAG